MERISNGIFAFTMTLLARDIVMPNIENAKIVSQDALLADILLATAPKAFNYLTAFAVLASSGCVLYRYTTISGL